MTNHTFTQEYVDAKAASGLLASRKAELANLYSSLGAMADLMADVNADQPRRAKFNTMYGKMASDYDKDDFDAIVAALADLKTYIDVNELIPEE